MAIYRNVSMSFWTDSKVSDDFTAHDRYVYLYLFTNPHSNLCGCYEDSYKQMAYETGLDVKEIKSIILKLQDVHSVICYDEKTKEVLLLNWHKYNWTSSEKFRRPLRTEIENIKTPRFKEYLLKIFDGQSPQMLDTVSNFSDTVSTEDVKCEYHTDTSVTVTVPNTISNYNSNTNNDKDMDSIREIVEYLNEVTGQHYKPTTKKTQDLIRARMNEKFTVEDFKTVIYKKTKQWKNDPKMCGFLRPQTLFGTKFESYLNEKTVVSATDRWDFA